jgi:hypothetical protein
MPVERLRVIMSLPLHQVPLDLTPSCLGREYPIQAFLYYLYHAWFHPILRCVSCSSIVHPNKSHLLLRCLKIHWVYLSGKPCEHRLRLAILAFVQFLFSGRWERWVSIAKTSVRFWPILAELSGKVTFLASIRNHDWNNASSLVELSTISRNHTLKISNDLPYD